MSKLQELIKTLCPEGMILKKIDDIATIRRGERITKNSLVVDGEYKVISGGVEPMGYYNKYNREKNTITISSYGYAGYVNFIEENFWANDVCLCVYPNNNSIDNKFLYYSLKNMENYFFSKTTKAIPDHIPTEIIKETCIVVPPLEIQKEIVHILDDFTFVTEMLSLKLSDELKARKKQYDYYRNELISNCDGKDAKLIDLLSQPITDGPHTTPQLYPSGVPFISATAVYDGKIHLEDAKGFISKEFDDECSKKYKPKKHDVYMVKSGSTTGKVAYVDTDADFNIWSPLAAMRTDNVISSRFLYHLLQTTDIQNQVQTRMSHGSQPNLSMRVLEQFDIKIPNLDEQKRIVDTLDRLDVLYNDILKKLPVEIEDRKKQYEFYRDKLLNFRKVEE